MRNMVAAISDLHFEEEGGDVIGTPGSPSCIRFNRNVPATAFEAMISDLAGTAEVQGVDHLDFILAGDVFDLHRTQLWFKGDETLRPYVNCAAVTPGSALETKILEILNAIAAEPEVSRSLAAFRGLASGSYLAIEGDKADPKKTSFTTTVHFIPGNHDRLANATPTIRARVRQLLGLPQSVDGFSHRLIFQDPPLLVRHGHEYDPTNFAINLRNKPISFDIPDQEYDKPTFGDFVTVMIASHLPVCFRKHYSDEAILGNEVYAAIYYRILEFDDVRPQSVVLDFFFNTLRPKNLENQFPTVEAWRKYIWRLLTPVLLDVFDEIARDKYFAAWLEDFGAGLALPIVKSRFWKLTGLPYWFSRLFGYLLEKGGGGPGAQSAAAKETALTNGITFIAAGHTHKPQVAHLFTDNGDKKYFADTGTWRNAVLAAGDNKSYGRLNATTYVAFYGKERDPRANPPGLPDHGFDYWTGYDQSWPLSGLDG